MNAWGASTFGNPCRLCGFDWSISQVEADARLSLAADRVAALLADTSAHARHPALGWTAGGYVCHVADSLRVWAERVACVALGDVGPVASYDQDRLAEARCYDEVGVRGALWSLDRALDDWRAALQLVADGDFLMLHDELGALSLLDVTRIRAHDVAHHADDIQRIVSVNTPAR